MRRVTADTNVFVSGLLYRRGKLRDTPAGPQPAVQLDVVHDDPDDNKILECAVTDGSEYVVTGVRIGGFEK